MTVSIVKPEAPCPCGRPASLANCCGRYHAGAPAPTAEALMRSRYSAYVLELGEYLLATWHPSTRPLAIDFADAPRWLGLSIKRTGLLGDADTQGLQKFLTDAAVEQNPAAMVEFVARYKIGGRAYRLHETSRFVFETGRWFYLDGEIHA